jgi:hypothetical protein
MYKRILLLVLFLWFSLFVKIYPQNTQVQNFEINNLNNQENYIFDEYGFLSLLGLNYDKDYGNNEFKVNPLILLSVNKDSSYINLEPVLIIKGKSNDVVNLFIQGFLSKYDINKVTIIDVNQARDYDIDKFPIVIALTSEAANFIKNNYNPKALNIYSLVLSPEYLGIENKFIGFSIYPDFNKIATEIKKILPATKNIGLIYSIGGYTNYQKEIKQLNLSFIPINVNNYNINKIEEQIKKCDVVFILPDIFTLEEENLFKIIYYAKKNNKTIVSTHNVLLNYGVDIIFSVDYKVLGIEVSNFIENYSLNKKVSAKNYMFFTDKFIIFTNKNYKL